MCVIVESFCAKIRALVKDFETDFIPFIFIFQETFYENETVSNHGIVYT